jgi:hypothetical protein
MLRLNLSASPLLTARTAPLRFANHQQPAPSPADPATPLGEAAKKLKDTSPTDLEAMEAAVTDYLTLRNQQKPSRNS